MPRLPACLVCAALVACGALAPAHEPRPALPDLIEAVQRGDAAEARRLLERGADPDARGDHGDTALMLAALYGDAELVRLLLDHRADPRRTNAAGTTALHWAIDDVAKTEALLAAGADPDAPAAAGVTPVMLAALREDGHPVVELLLAHGAAANRASGSGVRAVMLAAAADAASLGALIAHGADPDARTPGGHTALHAAAARGNVESVRLLLDAGVDANAVTDENRTPIMWAAQMGSREVVTLLLDHGANPDLRETFSGTTALIQAAASDRADDEVVAALLAAGADVARRDDDGATAATWATRRGDPSVLAMIRARGNPVAAAPAASAPVASDPRALRGGRRAGPSNTVEQALARAVPLLERAGPAFRAESSCPSCHHNVLPAIALARAAQAGAAIDRAAQAREAGALVGALRHNRERFLQGLGFADIVEPAYFLAGLAAASYPRDDMTDAMVRYLVLRQTPGGGWRTMMQRMPMDGSDVSFTAVAVRALAVYAPPSRAAETRARIARARAYLLAADARTTEDLTFQALGLHWASASAAQIAPTIAALATRQRADGGFAQRGSLPSDAYATGQAIVALRDAGGVAASAPVVQRAVRFLLATQDLDGSWFVATRALPFQPWFDTGFPQGRSQFSSAGATAWATMALAAAAE